MLLPPRLEELIPEGHLVRGGGNRIIDGIDLRPSLPPYVAYQLRHGQPLGYTLVNAWLYNSTRRG